jgi:hypothetical protein
MSRVEIALPNGDALMARTTLPRNQYSMIQNNCRLFG